ARAVVTWRPSAYWALRRQRTTPSGGPARGTAPAELPVDQSAAEEHGHGPETEEGGAEEPRLGEGTVVDDGAEQQRSEGGTEVRPGLRHAGGGARRFGVVPHDAEVEQPRPRPPRAEGERRGKEVGEGHLPGQRGEGHRADRHHGRHDRELV